MCALYHPVLELVHDGGFLLGK
eukprot:COSAG03_NODE_27175_length_254_cov_3.122581_2_plen_21_part_01